MAYKRWEGENSIFEGFEYKPKTLNFFAEQAIKNKFYHYYQFCHKDSVKPVGISAISTCFCPYFKKAVSPNSAYIDLKYRGFGFYKEFYKILNRFIEEEQVGVFYTCVNYLNDSALKGRKKSKI